MSVPVSSGESSHDGNRATVPAVCPRAHVGYAGWRDCMITK